MKSFIKAATIKATTTTKTNAWRIIGILGPIKRTSAIKWSLDFI